MTSAEPFVVACSLQRVRWPTTDHEMRLRANERSDRLDMRFGRKPFGPFERLFNTRV